MTTPLQHVHQLRQGLAAEFTERLGPPSTGKSWLGRSAAQTLVRCRFERTIMHTTAERPQLDAVLARMAANGLRIGGAQ